MKTLCLFSAFVLVALCRSQTLDDFIFDESAVEGASLSTALREEAELGVIFAPVTKCFGLQRSNQGFLLARVLGPGFWIQPCDPANPTPNCYRRVKCDADYCLVAKSCVDTSGQNRCLRRIKCPTPCETLGFKLVPDHSGVIVANTPDAGFTFKKCNITGCVEKEACQKDCLTWKDCVDPTGGKRCFRIESCKPCEGKFKYIPASDGVRIVSADVGFQLEKCPEDGCLNEVPCSRGSNCLQYLDCNSVDGTTSCLKRVPCDYVEPAPCVDSVKFRRVYKGIQYKPVDVGFSFRQCPDGECFVREKCDNTAGAGQHCLAVVDCVSDAAATGPQCIEEISCCTPQIQFLPAQKSGVRYVPVAGDGVTLAPCNAVGDCYEVKKCTANSASGVKCQLPRKCQATSSTSTGARPTCFNPVPCCPKPVQLAPATPDEGFVLLSGATYNGFRLSTCGNQVCKSILPCVAGAPCYSRELCEKYPDEKCVKFIPCAADCENALTTTLPTTAPQDGLIAIKDHGVTKEPCPHKQNCFKLIECKYDQTNYCYKRTQCSASDAGCEQLAKCP